MIPAVHAQGTRIGVLGAKNEDAGGTISLTDVSVIRPHMSTTRCWR